MRRIIKKIYFWMQNHYLTFRFIVTLKEMGISRKINSSLFWSNNSNDIKHIESTSKSALFFKKNHNRVLAVKNLLADEKSKKVFDSVIEYRTGFVPIPKELFSENNQYFVNEIINFCDQEVFIDCGAYTGDTIQQFINKSRRKNINYKKIVAFEPDQNNYRILKKYYKKDNRIVLFDLGVSKSRETLYFKEDKSAACIVDKEMDATNKIEVTSLDEIEDCIEATWIKMDIEGAEMDALFGARNIIMKNKPKLSICIYHSDEDMLRIIEYVHELVPEYRLYVRHHTNIEIETVLYAIFDNREI